VRGVGRREQVERREEVAAFIGGDSAGRPSGLRRQTERRGQVTSRTCPAAHLSMVGWRLDPGLAVAEARAKQKGKWGALTCISPSCEPSLPLSSSHPYSMLERPLQKHPATLHVHCAGDAGGVARGLAEGDSAATHDPWGPTTWVVNVHAEDALNAGGYQMSGSSDVDSVMGIGRIGVAVRDPRTRLTRRPGYHPSQLLRGYGHSILLAHS
jgi:hypothetical protein